MDVPDKYTLAYWSQQISGLNVRTNRLDHEWESQYTLITALTARLEGFEAREREHMAMIGELKSQIAAIAERMDKASKVVADLTKKNGAAA